jgi:hypothetical protein
MTNEEKMTVDLKEHMEKKKQEKHIQAYNKMAKAMDGLTVGTILHITASFVAYILSNMPPEARMDAAMRFYTIIASDKEDTPQ